MSDESVFSKTELLARMRAGWDDQQAYFNTLTPKQFTSLTDAAGWTVKDHVMHLAVWEDGIDALLKSESRPVRMELDEATWNSRDYDHINAVIQQRHQDMPLDAVMQHFQEVHDRLITTIESLSEADLLLPYEHYQPGTGADKPVWNWIAGNTFGHYEEHRPWIAVIVR
ncbi:MAG: ClbS/DfsB family four-helix bundle protein [Anaerolineaceae bacterium]|nr:ClbS/DfsB family four-helix bundle protein [Anaerolineaceae bacterium]